jgi:hypothetical protein
LIELHGELSELLHPLSKSVIRLRGVDQQSWNADSTILQEDLTRCLDCHQKITTATQLFCLEEVKQKETSLSVQTKWKTIHDISGSLHSIFERIAVSVGLLLDGISVLIRIFFSIWLKNEICGVGSWSSSARSRDQNLLVVFGHLRESFESLIEIELSLRRTYEELFQLNGLQQSAALRDSQATIGIALISLDCIFLSLGL